MKVKNITGSDLNRRTVTNLTRISLSLLPTNLDIRIKVRCEILKVSAVKTVLLRTFLWLETQSVEIFCLERLSKTVFLGSLMCDPILKYTYPVVGQTGV